jgi:uncharacterized membrane protein
MIVNAALSSVGLGAGLMYFLDPKRGGRRRALVRDRIVHHAKLEAAATATAGRDIAHRARGVAARARRAVRRTQPDDRQLVERVRAQLGRVVSHARAIDVEACDGCVTLRGPVLHAEAANLLDAVRRVPGVRLVVDELAVRRRPEHIPSLQGGSTPPGLHADIWQRTWAPATRCLLGTAGLAVAVAGASRRNGAGAALAAAGSLLALRAATNLELRRLTGIGAGRRAVDLQKTITIGAPVEDVFSFWSNYENFPRFLSRVLQVRPSGRDGLSHWIVRGPAGMPIDFETEVSALVPHKVLGWRTVEGSRMGHAGLVRFEPVAGAQGAERGSTRVHVRMSYNPPAGWFGHEIARAFGADPKRSLDEDLMRMKTLLETGTPPHDAHERAYEP